MAAFPNDGVLKNHLHIMKHAEDSNFHKLLAGRVNGPITVQQFAEIFAKLFDEQLDILLTALFVLIFARTDFRAFAQTNAFASENQYRIYAEKDYPPNLLHAKIIAFHLIHFEPFQKAFILIYREYLLLY